MITANALIKMRAMSGRGLVASAVACVSAAALALGSPSAFGEKIYYPGVSVGWHVNKTAVEAGRTSEENVCPAPGHATDQCQPGEPGPEPGQFKEPVGVAINDETGDMYVADRGNGRVEYFDESGAFLGEFDGSAAPTGRLSTPEQVAVDNSGSRLDPSAGDVYVIDTGHNVIDKFSSTGVYEGQLTSTERCENGEEFTNGKECPKSKPTVVPLGELRNVAVGPSGDVWVFEVVAPPHEPSERIGLVDEFSEEGGFITRFDVHRYVFGDHALAADSNESVYVGVNPGRELLKFTAGGELIAEFAEGVNAGVDAVAVVPSANAELNNDLLADRGDGIARYGSFGEPNNEPLEEFPTGEDVSGSFAGLFASEGMAVDSSARVFASERGSDRVQSFVYVSAPAVVTEAPSEAEVSETGLTLRGTVDPEGESLSECFFEYGTEAGVYTSHAPCVPSPGNGTGHIGEGTASVPVSVKLSGLAPADVRSFRVVAVSGAGVIRRGKGLTISRPVVAGEGVLDVGVSEATVIAQIEPGGLETCYTIEYCAGESTSEKCIPGGEGAVGVSAELTGLAPGAECQFRVLAHNSLNVGVGGEFVFATFAPSTSGLPDGRVDEVVSPLGAGHSTEVYVPHGLVSVGLDEDGIHGIWAGGPSQAAPDGEEVAYVGDPPASGGNGNFGDGGGNQYVAKRSVGGGWTSVDLNAPSYGNEYLAYAGDLSAGVLRSSHKLGLGAPLGYSNLYQRDIHWGLKENGSFDTVLGTFEALITATPLCPAGQFGSVNNGEQSTDVSFGGGDAGGGTVAAFGHLLFEANGVLPSTPVAPATTPGGSEEGCGSENDLYDWVGGSLYLVNVLPNGEAAANAMFGREGPSTNGFFSPETSNVISSDGSRIYWSSVKMVPVGNEYEEQPQALYVRENDTQPQSEIEEGHCTEPGKACTVQVNLPEAGVAQVGVCKTKPEECEHPAFWTASVDGSRVFFTDESRLTRDATAQLGAPDLYQYDLEAPEGERLSDLSLPAGPGEQADMQGVVGASEDGSYVYFVADGALTEGANAEGREPVEGEPNLYLSHEGTTTFIATLSGGDDDFTEGTGGHYGDWQADPGHRTADVTPDGQSVAFTSRSRLTADGGLRVRHRHGQARVCIVQPQRRRADRRHRPGIRSAHPRRTRSGRPQGVWVVSAGERKPCGLSATGDFPGWGSSVLRLGRAVGLRGRQRLSGGV
jgi:hypothetical protein